MMNRRQYTYSVSATITFDVEAKSKREAERQAAICARLLRQGQTAAEFLARFDAGYIISSSEPILVDIYDSKR